MKNIVRKSLILLLALCMLATLFVGCDTNKPVESKPEDTKPTESEANPLAERIDMVCWLMGDEPADMKKVQDKINEILLEKINATITFNFTTWTEYKKKYSLLLSSGETIDLIYGADWMDYRKYALDDAFLPLDELLDTYMPNTKALGEARSFWDTMVVEDAIYAIPLFQSEYTLDVLAYRKDLADKYNLPKPDTLENLEAYLQGIKENEPNQVLLNPTVSNNDTSSFTGDEFYGFYNETKISGFALEFGYDDPNGEPVDYFGSEQFVTDMKRAKAWADAGYWPKNSLTQQSPGSIGDGGCVAAVVNPSQYIGFKDAAAKVNPDWELDYVLRCDVDNVSYSSLPTGNITCIPRTAQDPARAAMAIELLMTDKTLNNLLLYGIEGEHYTVDANGYYVDGPNNAAYGFEASNAWNFRNDEINLIRESDNELYDMFEHCNEIGMKMKYPNLYIEGLFTFDDTNVKTERAAVKSVTVEYLAPLEAGMVDDVDVAIAEFRKQMDIAGLQKVQDEWLNQWMAFCEENNFD